MTDRNGDRVGHTISDHQLSAICSADRTPTYNTAAVTHRTGILPATFRAWERRYGFPSPHRDPGHQRKYSEQEVQALEWLRERLGAGLTISTALALLRQHLDRRAPAPVPSAARSPASLVSELVQALLAFDEASADAVLGEAFALYSLEQACLDVLQPVLLDIGAGWLAGQVDSAQEHFAAALIRRRLADLLHLASPMRADRLVLAACAPDESHELGLLMVALFLARRGSRVVYLGASLPADDLLASMDRLQPDVVVLSATLERSAAAVVELAGRLPQRPRPLLAFGGQAFEALPAMRATAAGLYLGPSAITAIERLEGALIQSRP